MRANKNNPFHQRFLSNVKRITEKLNRDNGNTRQLKDLHELFQMHEGVECWSHRDLDDDKVPEDETNIIIVTSSDGVIRNASVDIDNDGNRFHLRTLVSMSHFEGQLIAGGNKHWNGTILSRHNSSFKVWCQKRSDKYSIQSRTEFDAITVGEEIVCAVCIRESQADNYSIDRNQGTSR